MGRTRKTTSTTIDTTDETSTTKRTGKPSNRQKDHDENSAQEKAAAKAAKQKRKEAAERRALREAAQPTVDQQRLADQAAELERLKKELADAHARNGLLQNTNTELSAANTTLRSQSTAVGGNTNTTNDVGNDSIPAPKGKRYHIQREMGLDTNQDLYDQILSTVHEVAGAAKILSKVTTVTYSCLDPHLKGQICQAICEKEPFLRRFSQNWAAYRLLHQYFKNARQYKRKKFDPNGAFVRRRNKNTKKGRDAARANGEIIDSSSSSDSESDSDSKSDSSSGENEQPSRKRLRRAVGGDAELEPEVEEEEHGAIPVAVE